MNLRPDCAGCAKDSNNPKEHEGDCNYRHWPGLYDTIEQQRQYIAGLQAQIMAYESGRLDNRYHDVFCLVLKEMIQGHKQSILSQTAQDIVETAKQIADLAYSQTKDDK